MSFVNNESWLVVLINSPDCYINCLVWLEEDDVLCFMSRSEIKNADGRPKLIHYHTYVEWFQYIISEILSYEFLIIYNVDHVAIELYTAPQTHSSTLSRTNDATAYVTPV